MKGIHVDCVKNTFDLVRNGTKRTLFMQLLIHIHIYTHSQPLFQNPRNQKTTHSNFDKKKHLFVFHQDSIRERFLSLSYIHMIYSIYTKLFKYKTYANRSLEKSHSKKTYLLIQKRNANRNVDFVREGNCFQEFFFEEKKRVCAKYSIAFLSLSNIVVVVFLFILT